MDHSRASIRLAALAGHHSRHHRLFQARRRGPHELPSPGTAHGRHAGLSTDKRRGSTRARQVWQHQGQCLASTGPAALDLELYHGQHQRHHAPHHCPRPPRRGARQRHDPLGARRTPGTACIAHAQAQGARHRARRECQWQDRVYRARRDCRGQQPHTRDRGRDTARDRAHPHRCDRPHTPPHRGAAGHLLHPGPHRLHPRQGRLYARRRRPHAPHRRGAHGRVVPCPASRTLPRAQGARQGSSAARYRAQQEKSHYHHLGAQRRWQECVSRRWASCST